MTFTSFLWTQCIDLLPYIDEKLDALMITDLHWEVLPSMVIQKS